jgi:hypothetical protein
MMAGGLAIIAICPFWSDLARLITQCEAGWVVSNSPYRSWEELTEQDYLDRVYAQRSAEEVGAEFAGIIGHIQLHRDELERRRHNARKAASLRYGPEQLADRWDRFLRLVLG